MSEPTPPSGETFLAPILIGLNLVFLICVVSMLKLHGAPVYAGYALGLILGAGWAFGTAIMYRKEILWVNALEFGAAVVLTTGDLFLGGKLRGQWQGWLLLIDAGLMGWVLSLVAPAFAAVAKTWLEAGSNQDEDSPPSWAGLEALYLVAETWGASPVSLEKYAQKLAHIVSEPVLADLRREFPALFPKPDSPAPAPAPPAKKPATRKKTSKPQKGAPFISPQ